MTSAPDDYVELAELLDGVPDPTSSDGLAGWEPLTKPQPSPPSLAKLAVGHSRGGPLSSGPSPMGVFSTCRGPLMAGATSVGGSGGPKYRPSVATRRVRAWLVLPSLRPPGPHPRHGRGAQAATLDGPRARLIQIATRLDARRPRPSSGEARVTSPVGRPSRCRVARTDAKQPKIDPGGADAGHPSSVCIRHASSGWARANALSPSRERGQHDLQLGFGRSGFDERFGPSARRPLVLFRIRFTVLMCASARRAYWAGAGLTTAEATFFY